MSEIEAGWMMVALSAPVLLMPAIAAQWRSGFPRERSAVWGFVLAAAGLLWLSTTTQESSGLDIVLPLILIGIGSGIPWGLMDGLSVMVVPTERAGMAAGIINTTSRQ